MQRLCGHPGSRRTPTQHPGPQEPCKTLCPCVLNLSGFQVLAAKEAEESSWAPFPKPLAHHVYMKALYPGAGIVHLRIWLPAPQSQAFEPLENGGPTQPLAMVHTRGSRKCAKGHVNK